MPDFAPRSLLFMPAHKERLHEKAKTLPADAIILDLEDAVGEESKAEARNQLAVSLHRLSPFPCLVLVRVNDANSTHYAEDIRHVTKLASEGLVNGVVLPKVEEGSDIQRAARQLPAQTRLWANIETPRAILNLTEIATSTPSLAGLIAGINDLSAELQLSTPPVWQPRIGLHHALSHMVLVARAHGLFVIDGVYNRIDDAAGLQRECAEGRELGFDGKSLIHPSHLQTANRAYTPSDTEYEIAKALVAAYEKSAGGAVRHAGSMVEALHAQRAKRIVSCVEHARKNV